MRARHGGAAELWAPRRPLRPGYVRPVTVPREDRSVKRSHQGFRELLAATARWSWVVWWCHVPHTTKTRALARKSDEFNNSYLLQGFLQLVYSSSSSQVLTGRWSHGGGVCELYCSRCNMVHGLVQFLPGDLRLAAVGLGQHCSDFREGKDYSFQKGQEQ